jgi:hypothetical protein
MCMMCDGASPDEVIDRYGELIDEHGWVAVGVGGTARAPGWIYTIGLTETYNHPELVVVTCSVDAAHRRLRGVIDGIAEGRYIEAGRQVIEGVGPAECRAVATNQLEAGLIAYWPTVAHRQGWDLTVPAVIQIEARDLLCADHDRVDWDLSRPFPVFTGAHQDGGVGFRRRSGGPSSKRSATRARRVSGDPRNRPRRWAS